MKYSGMPWGMWLMFSGSFRKQLTGILGYDKGEAREIIDSAKPEYRRIIAKIPEFEKTDRFKMNIVNCAMLSAVVLHMPKRPTVEQLAEYYASSMMIPAVKWFCRKSGKKKFTSRDIAGMEQTAALKAADRNPYSWNMDLFIYPDGSGYEARFTKCGICTLAKELGLYDLVPAMCRLDYNMAEAGKTSDFIREYTLASGDPFCDCGYKKKK